MARARNIKPGFFKNEDLAECSPWARLCFAGLWTLADREGRLEDRAKRIKGELFPFDSIEVEPLLVELAKWGFILRYTVDARDLIQILAFHKHQNPHHREPKSDLQPPQSPGLDGDGNNPKPRTFTSCNEPKAQGEPEASPGLDPPKSDLARGSSRADSGFLIPDSGIKTSVEVLSAAGPPQCPAQQLLTLFAERAPELPQPRRELWDGSAGAEAMRQRWRWLLTATREDGNRYAVTVDEGIDWFGRFFANVSESDLLMGRVGKWRADLAWLMKKENFAKVVQGNYTNRAHREPA